MSLLGEGFFLANNFWCRLRSKDHLINSIFFRSAYVSSAELSSYRTSDRLYFGAYRTPTILLWFIAALISVSCEIPSDAASSVQDLLAGNSIQPDSNLDQECVERFDSEIDYFPEKTALEYAGNFTVEYHRSYKLVTVIEPFPGSGPESYVLLQCGAPLPDLPDGLENSQLIRLPIDQIYLDSTTAIPSLVDLEALDPFHVAVSRHLGHVVPVGMAGKGKEVEMFAGQVDRPFQASLGIPDRIVVVEVPPEQLVGRTILRGDQVRFFTDGGRHRGSQCATHKTSTVHLKCVHQLLTSGNTGGGSGDLRTSTTIRRSGC